MPEKVCEPPSFLLLEFLVITIYLWGDMRGNRKPDAVVLHPSLLIITFGIGCLPYSFFSKVDSLA